MKYFRMVWRSASGFLFEMAPGEVLTLFGDSERDIRYKQIAKKCVEQYCQP